MIIGPNLTCGVWKGLKIFADGGVAKIYFLQQFCVGASEPPPLIRRSAGTGRAKAAKPSLKDKLALSSPH